MKLKTIYLVLCLLGAVLPYWQFVPWLVENGLNMPLFFQQLFANHIGAFFGMDVFVSAAALLVFVRSEGSRLGVAGRWLPVIAVLAVGVSLGLPLFLYLRDYNLEVSRDKRQDKINPEVHPVAAASAGAPEASLWTIYLNPNLPNILSPIA